MAKTISVIIPVYFNEPSLRPLHEELTQLERELKNRGAALELIFVNDGSEDRSQEELMRIKSQRPATKVIRHTRNFGAIAASKTGFRYATGDCFVVHSADLQDPTEQILKMYDEWAAGHKYVICVRTAREDDLPTRAFAAFYYALIRWIVAPDYPKGGFDLMLSDREILPHLLSSDRHVNPNIFAYSLGYAPKILHYARRARPYGKSRWTFRKKLNHMVNTITSFSAAPIRFFSALGFAVAAASFLYGMHMAISAWLGKVDAPGFATIVVLISFFSGLILMTLGVLGEYLYRTFERVGAKPESVVESVYL